MAEIMSMTEIQAKFESEWVLLDDPETDERLEIKGDRVLWHRKDRDEVYRKAREMRPQHSAVLYTGKLLEEMAVVL